MSHAPNTPYDPHPPEEPDLGEVLGQLAELGAGLAVVLLPLLTTALPGVFLFLVVPAVLVAAPLLAAALVLAAPYLLARSLAEHRRAGR